MKKVLFTATLGEFVIRFLLPYLKYFKENGYEIHVACNGNTIIPYADKYYNIPFCRSPYKHKNLRAYSMLKKIIKENEFDLIHCHTPTAGVLTRFAARKARKKGTKVLYTAHGFHFYKSAPILNWLLFYPAELFCSVLTDGIITINNEDYKAAKKLFSPKVYRVDGVGVDFKRFFPVSSAEKQRIRDEFDIDKQDFVLIYVAELNKNKNQSLIINALHKLTNDIPAIKAVFVGGGK